MTTEARTHTTPGPLTVTCGRCGAEGVYTLREGETVISWEAPAPATPAATDAAAYDLACTVSAFLVDARRIGNVAPSALGCLTRCLDAYNEARERTAPATPPEIRRLILVLMGECYHEGFQEAEAGDTGPGWTDSTTAARAALEAAIRVVCDALMERTRERDRAREETIREVVRHLREQCAGTWDIEAIALEVDALATTPKPGSDTLPAPCCCDEVGGTCALCAPGSDDAGRKL